MIKVIDYSEIEKEFGKHGDTKSLEKIMFPFKMFLSWKPEVFIESAAVHTSIKSDLEEVFSEIKEYYGESYIYENSLNSWGGCYNDRYSRSSARWSTHSWGLAVDYLPNLGPFGTPAQTPYVVVEAFKDHGFLWGGDWSRPDGMHFSAVRE